MMLDLIYRGGWALWVIVVFSVISLGVTLERLLTMRKSNLNAKDLMNRISDALNRDDIPGAIAACEATGGPLAETLAAGLRKVLFMEEMGMAQRPEEVQRAIVEAMESHGSVAVDGLEQNLTTLATIASLAPILGMMGTVFGMIRAFGSINTAGSLTPEAVAGGISEALLCTAGGLIVAAFATVEFNYFTAKVNRFVVQVEAAGAALVERVIRARTRAAAATGGAGNGDGVTGSAPPIAAEGVAR